MIPFYDSSGARRLDEIGIEEIGIPSILLMENAAIGITNVILENHNGEYVVILSGTGNNGGDGLAVARHLLTNNIEVEVFIVGKRELSHDTAVQLKIIKKLGIKVTKIEDESDIEILRKSLGQHPLVVDALFGTGLRRPLRNLYKAVVETINSIDLRVISVDLPSGLDASKASIIGPTVQADITVALGTYKIPHVVAPGVEYVGTPYLVDIGFPDYLLDKEPVGYIVEENDILNSPLFIPRKKNSHKKSFGHLLVIGGSIGKTGAAILAAKSAQRIGVGVVTVALPNITAHTADSLHLSSMTLPFDSCNGQITLEGAKALLQFTKNNKIDCAVVGPGLGEAYENIKFLVKNLDIPMVIDADAINSFAESPKELASIKAPKILTPHPGEAARLLGIDSSYVSNDRIGTAKEIAKITNSIVILKGFNSVIASPSGDIYLNTVGGPELSTAGSGDVLGGIVGGLLGYSKDILDAAITGTYIHGLTGELAKEEVGEKSVTAEDLIEYIPEAILELEKVEDE